MLTRYGEVVLALSHPYSHTPNGSKMSAYLQELLLSTTVENTYTQSKELIENFLGIEINEMQLTRITSRCGKALETKLATLERLQPLPAPKDVVYAMGDGSMVLTREEKWKEVKLGRIFTGHDCLQIEGKVNQLKTSQYVSHFGDCKTFTDKMERVLDAYGNLGERLIFISDGATWLKNWIEDAYPNAISILDFFHAKEYLCDFAKEHFKDEDARKQWIDAQEQHLLQSETKKVIDTIKTITEHQKIPPKIIEYYQSNINRMDYKRYLTIGKGIIGSGAIESAHRTVIQCRMKLSGQRWSKKGAENMLCLRTIKMNNKWEMVIKYLKTDNQKKTA